MGVDRPARLDAAAAQEDVADHAVPAVAVIEVNGAGMACGVAYVAEEIVADEISAAGWIAAFVECTGVLSVCDDVANDVVFHDIVVPCDEDRLVRRIVNQIVCRPVSDTGQRDRVSAGALKAGKVVDFVIDANDGRMSASVDHHPPGKAHRAGVINVAGIDEVV